MARTDPQVNFRIPAELKISIENAAAASNRTVTAEIVSRLEGSFEPSSDTSQLQEDLERADHLIELQDKLIRTMAVTDDLLSSYLVEVVGELQKSTNDPTSYSLIADFARANLEQSSGKMAAVLRKVVQGDAELTAAIDDEMGRLAPVIAARRRDETGKPSRGDGALQTRGEITAMVRGKRVQIELDSTNEKLASSELVLEPNYLHHVHKVINSRQPKPIDQKDAALPNKGPGRSTNARKKLLKK